MKPISLYGVFTLAVGVLAKVWVPIPFSGI